MIAITLLDSCDIALWLAPSCGSAGDETCDLNGVYRRIPEAVSHVATGDTLPRTAPVQFVLIEETLVPVSIADQDAEHVAASYCL